VSTPGTPTLVRDMSARSTEAVPCDRTR
jgi:hypothetical protein